MPTDTKLIDPTTSKRARLLTWNLAMITAISFSLTFAGVSIALLAGLLPTRFASLSMPVDMGVVLLTVPLCALILAMVAEVLRAAIQKSGHRTLQTEGILLVARGVTSLPELTRVLK